VEEAEKAAAKAAAKEEKKEKKQVKNVETFWSYCKANSESLQS
jgi:hypothetical protein